ncbi:MAG: hypothetical protein ACRBCS_07235 [Cellvibrionaceae bacterium]
MSIDGNWEVSMSTPMGDQKATLTLKEEAGALTGRVESPMGSEDISGSVDGDNAKWEMSISKPMPMTLKFDVTADGDTMSGKVGLGMFGSADMTGKRV